MFDTCRRISRQLETTESSSKLFTVHDTCVQFDLTRAMFADVEINIFVTFVSPFFSSHVRSNIFSSRYRGCREDLSTRIVRSKNATRFIFTYETPRISSVIVFFMRFEMPAHLFYELSANLPSLKARIQTLSKLPPAFSPFRGEARALGDAGSVYKRMGKRSSRRSSRRRSRL